MSQKTYVLVANSGSSREPYSPYVFNTRGLALKCKGVDERFDLIFSTAQEMSDSYSRTELQGVYVTLCSQDGTEPQEMHTPLEVAKALFTWTISKATPYATKQGNSKVEHNVEAHEHHPVEAEAVEPVAEKPAKAKKPKSAKVKKEKVAKAPKAPKENKGTRDISHRRYTNEQTIHALVEKPPLNEGSNRYRNMQIVLTSATVGDALRNLRAQTPPGVAGDIDLAVEKGAIEIR